MSEFGKQRLAEEDLSGPVELKKENEEELDDVEEEGNSNNIEVSEGLLLFILNVISLVIRLLSLLLSEKYSN